MDYRKETVKSPAGEGVRYYPIQNRTVSLREVAKLIKLRRGVSDIDTMRVVWNFFEEIVPMLCDGDRIEITDYCILSAAIKKGTDGKPAVNGIQLTPTGAFKKALKGIQLKERLNTDKTTL